MYYPLPTPTFERNAATLRALQSLMAENKAADLLRGLLYDAQCEELELAKARAEMERDLQDIDDMERESGSSAQELLSLLEASLSGPAAEALDSLAEAAVLLGCSTSTIKAAPSIGQQLRSSILQVSQQTFALETQIRSLDEQIARFQISRHPKQDELGASKSDAVSSTALDVRPRSYNPFRPTIDLDLVSSDINNHNTANDPSDPDSATLHAQTQHHQLETKQLQLKAREYTERITQLTQHQSQPQSTTTASIAHIAAKQQRLEAQADEIKRLESAIRAFNGLPPDVEASRSEVKRAMVELEALKSKRAVGFEELGG
ncbi:hypothetical protein LTR84_004498 [Exophiala bonariae]|uniref:Uncharacterized protein n=1 Tax=Exophiala bonariae TaxID=1690606 RepID=A0AAV9N716_9EURO|nr:hypothetical protein LTR84_004498 [Exophiala bonariae]